MGKSEKQTVDLPKKRIIDFETSELIDELSARKEIEASVLASSVNASVMVSGPAKVLVATLDEATVRAECVKKLAELDAIEGILDEIDASPVLYESLAGMRSEVLSGGREAV